MDAQALSEVARRHGIALVIRFGSTVTGHTHPGSDVDLGVLFERLPQTLDEELRTIADLQPLDSGRPVDVAVLSRAGPLLLKQVTGHARIERALRRLPAIRLQALCGPRARSGIGANNSVFTNGNHGVPLALQFFGNRSSPRFVSHVHDTHNLASSSIVRKDAVRVTFLPSSVPEAQGPGRCFPSNRIALKDAGRVRGLPPQGH